MDLILSSGFLAFARHLGVLAAIEARGLETRAVVGTSSGALVGALFQAGMPLPALVDLLAAKPPLAWMALSKTPWRGVFSTQQVASILRKHLPQRFEDLPKPFAVGVCDAHGQHRLIYRGELMPALLASTAMPFILPRVRIAGVQYGDGGIADRVGVAAWRHWRPRRRAIIHVVARSRGRDVSFDTEGTWLILTPRARAHFWSLGDFKKQMQEAREVASGALERASTLT